VRKNAKKAKSKGSRVGADLVEAFEELAAYLRGEIEVESYEVPDNACTRLLG
jgi:putative transcriptional regulator